MLEEKDEGGAFHSRVSFKNQYGHPVPSEKGITRRDWLAGLAMQGLMDAYARCEIDDYFHDEVADDAYKFADAMIEQGKK